MSVINKMLKDLDQRQEGKESNVSGSEVTASSSSATTQPKPNFSALTLILLVIAILLAFIGYQMLLSNSDKPAQNTDQVSPNLLASNNGTTTQIEPQETVPEPELDPDPAAELEEVPAPELELTEASPEEPEVEPLAEQESAKAQVITQEQIVENIEPLEAVQPEPQTTPVAQPESPAEQALPVEEPTFVIDRLHNYPLPNRSQRLQYSPDSQN